MTKMTRRSVVAGGMAIFAAAAAGPAYTQTKQKLRFSSAFTETDLRAEAYKSFAAAVKDDSISSPIGATPCSSRVPSSSHFSVIISISAIWRRRTFQNRSRLGRCLPLLISSATPTT